VKQIKREIRFEEGDRFIDANVIMDTTKEKLKMAPRLS
jgi:hypothetical protein